jgi:hypothetical protein
VYKWYCVQCCFAALHTVSFVHSCCRTHICSYLIAGTFSLGIKQPTQVHLVVRLRMHGTGPPLPHTPTWLGA